MLGFAGFHLEDDQLHICMLHVCAPKVERHRRRGETLRYFDKFAFRRVSVFLDLLLLIVLIVLIEIHLEDQGAWCPAQSRAY